MLFIFKENNFRKSLSLGLSSVLMSQVSYHSVGAILPPGEGEGATRTLSGYAF